MYHRKIAEKCLAMVQADYENYLAGLGAFRIEKYTGKGWTDVIEYFEEWLKTKKKKKPATYKGYSSYFTNWIKPFFKQHPVMLHEIQLDTLDKLLAYVRLSPKGKYNVMNCFHAFMDYAWRSKRIPEMPPFPKKSDYGLVEPTIKWLPEDRQMKIIFAIPESTGRYSCGSNTTSGDPPKPAPFTRKITIRSMACSSSGGRFPPESWWIRPKPMSST